MKKAKTKQIDHYQIRFDQEVFIDLFAGGGGASMGMEEAAGMPVYAAVNHDRDAIDLHAANHKYTKHYQTDVWDVEPIDVCEGRPVGLLWASPDCKHFSKARGGKPVNKNIRSLSWVVLKWALEVRPRVLMMENVEEIKTWGPLIYIKRGDTKVWVPDPEHVGETFIAFIGMLTSGGDRSRTVLEPGHTQVSKAEECLVAPSLIQYHTEQTDYVRAAGLDAPINTVDAANRYGLASASLVEYYGNGNPLDVAEPMHTVTAHDREAVVAVHIDKYFAGEYKRCGDAADAPLSTVTSLPRHGIVGAHIARKEIR